MRSSFSKEWLTESSEEGEDDKTDKSYSVGSSSDSEKGLLPASKWQYLNLKDTNIFYNLCRMLKLTLRWSFQILKKLLKSIGVLPQRICRI